MKTRIKALDVTIRDLWQETVYWLGEYQGETLSREDRLVDSLADAYRETFTWHNWDTDRVNDIAVTIAFAVARSTDENDTDYNRHELRDLTINAMKETAL